MSSSIFDEKIMQLLQRDVPAQAARSLQRQVRISEVDLRLIREVWMQQLLLALSGTGRVRDLNPCKSDISTFFQSSTNVDRRVVDRLEVGAERLHHGLGLRELEHLVVVLDSNVQAHEGLQADELEAGVEAVAVIFELDVETAGQLLAQLSMLCFPVRACPQSAADITSSVQLRQTRLDIGDLPENGPLSKLVRDIFQDGKIVRQVEGAAPELQPEAAECALRQRRENFEFLLLDSKLELSTGHFFTELQLETIDEVIH